MAGVISGIRGFVLTAPWLVGLCIADVALSTLVLVKAVWPDAAYEISSAIAAIVWTWIQRIFTVANGAHITVSGDALPQGESAIVVANHVAWADFYMIQELALRCGMLRYCRYFAKIQLRMVPFLGWGLWAMGMPMVSRKWDKDKQELDRVFSGIVDRKWPTWLVSFSEAARYTPEKYQESVAWCKTNNRRQPKNLLYPRTKGFIATVQHLRQAPGVKAVYDLTIAYQRGPHFHTAPSMWDTLSVGDLSAGPKGYRFHVHARRFPVAELPETDDELAGWLEQRWVEKGEWLEAKKTEWATEAKEQ